MIYMNNAATSYPKPPEVLDAVNLCLSTPPIDSKRAVARSGEGCDVVTACRTKLAEMFRISNAKHISFTAGATHALNLAIRGLDLKRAHVVTTALEHSAVLRALQLRKSEGTTDYTVVGCDAKGTVDPDSIVRVIRDDTRALIVNHASNVVNAVVDLGTISEIAHEYGLLLVIDTSQSAGHVPLDVRALDPDVVVFTAHKALYGIAGLGAIYVSERTALKPLIVGGTGLKSDSLHQTEDRPEYYEAGTQNLVGIAALGAGISHVAKGRSDTAARHMRHLHEALFNGLTRIPKVVTYGCPEYSLPLLSMNLHGRDPRDVARAMAEKYNIVVRAGLCCAPLVHRYLGTEDYGGVVRISYSSFTTSDEIEAVLAAVKELAVGRTTGCVSAVPGRIVSCY